MSPVEWETALTRHYLRSDGPQGAGPLRFIDAAPEELAKAIGRPPRDADVVLTSFLRAFGTMSEIRAVLTHAHRPRSFGSEGPGWFRYLILTCVVAASSEDMPEEGDFRERMRLLFGWPTAIIHLQGIPELWRALIDWCERKRRDGQPYRRVILPPRGTMRQIGESVRIAFPSRLDRRRFFGLVREHYTGGPTDVPAVLRLLAPRVESMPWSDGFRAAFDDFAHRYRRGARLLSDHAFWQLFRGAWAAAEDDVDPGEETTRLRLIVDLDEEVMLELSSTAEVMLSQPVESADGITLHVAVGRPNWFLGEVLSSRVGSGAKTISLIATSVAKGVLPFVERRWGQWLFEPSVDIGPVRVLVSGAVKARIRSDTTWVEVDRDWYLSSAIGVGAYEDLLQGFGSALPTERKLTYARAFGGVKVGSGYLGRPEFLPSIEAAPGVNVVAEPKLVRRGELAVTCDRAVVRLISERRLDGTWSISLWEGTADTSGTELSLTFTERALEHDIVELGDRAGWDHDVETCGLYSTVGQPQGDSESRPTTERMLNLLEAVYAGGRTGWATNDLVDLIEQARGPRVWDLIRSLREGGWLDLGHATRWGASRWFLRRPKLVRASMDIVVLDGATCETTRDRFRAIASRLGSTILDRAGLGDWAVPTLAAVGGDSGALAVELGIGFDEEPPQRLRPAPACWPTAAYDATGRGGDTHWCWNSGRFVRAGVEAGERVRLERLIRANGDARDVYRVTTDGGKGRILESRTAAILEAHRLARVALYMHQGSLLVRRRRDGFLPLTCARMLRLRHLLAPGAVTDEAGAYSYAYPCTPFEALNLSAVFGPAVAGPADANRWVDHALVRQLGPRGRGLLNPRSLPAKPSLSSNRSHRRS